MIVARVVGNVWATRKHKDLNGKKLLLVMPLDPQTGSRAGGTILAIDESAGAGIGDTVLLLDEGSSCRKILGTKSGPTRTIVVGVVDSIMNQGELRKYH
jgi:ethanolamine utilization protein EutN